MVGFKSSRQRHRLSRRGEVALYHALGRALVREGKPLGTKLATIKHRRKARMEETIYATEDEIKRARKLYQTDEIEIDDLNVKVSIAEGGTWIAAWVWLPNEETEGS